MMELNSSNLFRMKTPVVLLALTVTVYCAPGKHVDKPGEYALILRPCLLGLLIHKNAVVF